MSEKDYFHPKGCQGCSADLTLCCAAGVPRVAAVPVRGVSVPGLRGGRDGGELGRVPRDAARQHHAHGPGARADVESTAGTSTKEA